MIHKIHTVLDNNSRRQIFAVVANMIDWNSAFVRKCPKLGVESFQKNGVRNSLIPILVSFFQERHQSVKWRGIKTPSRRINGGGPQGATLGIIEYLSQSSKSAECVRQDERYKFVDDLTILEIVNLLTVGISSYNIKHHIPNDIIQENQFIPPENLDSQRHLNEINTWTKNQLMKINETKTKTMVFNFTQKYQFSTRLKLNHTNIETVTETKLLGTILTNDLTWERNTEELVKKAYARMEMLRKLSSFGAPHNDMKQVYISFIRSLLEQSCNVWSSSLTVECQKDIERVQKIALKIILKDQYKSYENALKLLDLETLTERRSILSLKFAKKCLKNPKMKNLFPPSKNKHEMTKRNPEHFQVFHANTDRLRNSAIIHMQKQLNQEVTRRKKEDSLWNI